LLRDLAAGEALTAQAIHFLFDDGRSAAANRERPGWAWSRKRSSHLRVVRSETVKAVAAAFMFGC
jgi:hypothetical protein